MRIATINTTEAIAAVFMMASDLRSQQEEKPVPLDPGTTV